MKELSRCTGQCCEAFTIQGKTLQEVKEKYEEALKNNSNDKQYIKDLFRIQDMLIDLGKHLTHPIHPEIKIKTQEPVTFFTCKYFNKETRLCTDYDNRPKMCKDYPFYNNDGKCEYPGCTFTFEKEESEYLLKNINEENNVKEEIH